jgi:UDP-N-acetylglucosamine 2-epimerase (non-hydrolysing)
VGVNTSAILDHTKNAVMERHWSNPYGNGTAAKLTLDKYSELIK